jgi:sugar phosphate isomerase/epimerase
MNLAVSNIAWPHADDERMAAQLSRYGVRGLEIAPTKIWQDPLAATPGQVTACRRSWEGRGIAIVAAQALLFGRPELTLFESPSARAATAAYLEAIIRLCADLGATRLVFGSPKNRRIGTMPPAQALDIAVDFFGGLAEVAHACGAAIGALGAPAAGASPRPDNDPEIALPSMEPATEPAIEEPKVPIIEGPCG